MGEGPDLHPSPEGARGQGSAGLLLALTLLPLTVASCRMQRPFSATARQTGMSATTAHASAGSAVDLSSGDLLRDPSPVAGQVATMCGAVGEVFRARLFTLYPENLGPSEEWLVVIPTRTARRGYFAAHEALGEHDTIQVTGTVRTFVRGVMQHDLGRDPGEALSRKWEGRPVLVASSLIILGQNGERGVATKPVGQEEKLEDLPPAATRSSTGGATPGTASQR